MVTGVKVTATRTWILIIESRKGRALDASSDDDPARRLRTFDQHEHVRNNGMQAAREAERRWQQFEAGRHLCW